MHSNTVTPHKINHLHLGKGSESNSCLVDSNLGDIEIGLHFQSLCNIEIQWINEILPP